jgi:hypothetical protein
MDWWPKLVFVRILKQLVKHNILLSFDISLNFLHDNVRINPCRGVVLVDKIVGRTQKVLAQQNFKAFT